MAKEIPKISRVGSYIKEKLFFSSSKAYWHNRYDAGGNSGEGSYGRLAEYKATLINEFIAKHKVESAIEFGCGDGNQLSLFKVSTYIGLDISPKAIVLCNKKFKSDRSKSFFLYDTEAFIDNSKTFSADLALSLDIIYHLVEDKIYLKYMEHLFNSAKKYVLIYSFNKNENKGFLTPHVKSREFISWVKEHKKDWELIETIHNKYAESGADFYIFQKKD
jgi:hypothetical protein